MLSYITPPVALAAVAAAAIAKCNPFTTGFASMRMGTINFILPFLFVLNPTLILIGEPLPILHNVTTAAIAVWLMASSFEGWLYGIGRIGWESRVPLALAALGLLVPGALSDVIGVLITALVYGYGYVRNRRPVLAEDQSA